ncbi:MAG: sigma-54 dependent transcriptional regulator [Bacteroidota bacterium]
MSELARLVIIGAGKGGTALLDVFLEDTSIKVVGVVDTNLKAPAMKRALAEGIPTSRELSSFLYDPTFSPNLIIDATGNQEVWRKLQAIDDPSIHVMRGTIAKFIWELLREKQDKKILEEKYEDLKSRIKDLGSSQLIIGSNPVMLEVDRMIDQVAPTNSTVLIIGETGTGKEMIAQAIQSQSVYKDKVFLKINCTAFSPQLLESELFGYKKGAFTGAVQDKKGLLETADGGTIFLDEIGDISLEMQAKLLRYLQFGEIRPVGSNETKQVQSRVIAATNRNLEEQIKKKEFREDLYYRLNTFTIELPPLRQRKEDIPLLSQYFLKKAVNKLNKRASSINSRALALLSEYEYPGNLRELQSVIERSVIMCNGDEIGVEDLPSFVQSLQSSFFLKGGFANSREKVIGDFERRALIFYLTESNGKVTEAAQKAGIPRRTFYRMLKKYGLGKESITA